MLSTRVASWPLPHQLVLIIVASSGTRIEAGRVSPKTSLFMKIINAMALGIVPHPSCRGHSDQAQQRVDLVLSLFQVRLRGLLASFTTTNLGTRCSKSIWNERPESDWTKKETWTNAVDEKRLVLGLRWLLWLAVVMVKMDKITMNPVWVFMLLLEKTCLYCQVFQYLWPFYWESKGQASINNNRWQSWGGKRNETSDAGNVLCHSLVR